MSVNVWNATEQKLEQVSGNVNVNDSAVSEGTTYSSEKIEEKFSDVFVNLGVLADLKTTEKSNLVGAINEVAEKGGGSDEYSTEEKVIGKWIDGKPIYRKVLTFTNVSTNIDLSELNINNIIIINITLKQNNNNIITVPYAPNAQSVYDAYIVTGYYKGTTKEWIWQIGSSAIANFSRGTLIIEYTKTTD